MKRKIFVAREIQYFEIGIFSFNSYVYYLTRGFIALTRAFNLLTRAFNLPTCAFSPLTRELELVTPGFELVTRGFVPVTRNSCFTFPLKFQVFSQFLTMSIKVTTLPSQSALSCLMSTKRFHKIADFERKDINGKH